MQGRRRLKERRSRPANPQSEPELDDEQQAYQFTKNSYRQAKLLESLIGDHLGKFFTLKLSTLLDLNRVAEEGLKREPGALRQEPIEIENSRHQPPDAAEVPRLLEDMLEYVNSNWLKSPLHLASYVMWRLNWIHPFRDGNGRTSRAASYLVLCVRLEKIPPGSVALPQRIKAEHMERYYEALEDADDAWDLGELDVSSMEALLGEVLLAQVKDAALETRRSGPPSRDSKKRDAATPSRSNAASVARRPAKKRKGGPRKKKSDEASREDAPLARAKSEALAPNRASVSRPWWKSDTFVVSVIGGGATIIGAIITAGSC